jgi:hypothetical protein
VTVSPSAFSVEHAIRVVVTQRPVVFRAGTTAGGADLIPQITLDTGTHSLAFQPVTSSEIVIRDCSNQGAQWLPAIKAGSHDLKSRHSHH